MVTYIQFVLPRADRRMGACVLFLLCGSMVPAVRADAVLIPGPQFRVSDLGAAHAEPHVAAHPSDPGRLVAAAIHFAGEQEAIVESYSSTDGGKTWSLSHFPGLQEVLAGGQMRTAADPWVAFDADGGVYASAIASMNPGHQWGLMPMLFYRSRNQGSTWEGPTAIGPFFDRPALVVTGRGGRKRIFAAGMAFTVPADPAGVGILRSDDDGAGFQRTLFYPSSLGHNGLNPVVTPDGVLMVPYVDFPARNRQQYERRSRLMRTSRIYVVASRDEGRTFGVPRFVADIPRFDAGFPEMAVDLSGGPYRGRLYLAWNGERAEDRNVVVARSDDGGETWLATAVKAPNGGPAFFSSLAVSKDGVIGVAWIQHEARAGSRHCWRTYFAASGDGGVTFTPPAVISGARHSCPTSTQKGMLRERGGDYIGLSAAANGMFHAVWPDSRDGALQIYTTSIEVLWTGGLDIRKEGKGRKGLR